MQVAGEAVHTSETQTVATVARMDSSCMLKVYGPSLNSAVPDCTRNHRATQPCPSDHSRAAEEQGALQVLRCAIKNSAKRGRARSRSHG
jgi:hypothetical protein